MADDGPLLSRRALLRLGAASALGFAGGRLAFALPEPEAALAPAPRAVLTIWLAGGPSQLETFDPHPGTRTGGPTRAIPTRLPGVQLAAGYPRLAERLDRVALIRSLVTKEGEHQRGRQLLRTGYAPLPTVQRPSLGAVVADRCACAGLELPPHVALLGNEPPRGGFLGAHLDAFAVGDPRDPIQDLVHPRGQERVDRLLSDLDLLEREFAAGRDQADPTQHAALARRADAMMRSPQVRAFATDQEPVAVREAYGATPFGRACLAARRLLETGVPAVEVTLDGWDSHAGNFEAHQRLAEVLDPALAALLDDLGQRGLLERTVLLVGGEFGRTPRINPLDGRDHWTQGFSWLVAGRGLRPGLVLGATDPAGERPPEDPVDPLDLLATVYRALDLDVSAELTAPSGRPVRVNEGQPIAQLLRA